MAEPAKKIATYQDVLDAPDNVVAEIIHGELITSPRPTPQNIRAGARLGAKLINSFDLGEGGPGGWVILPEPELHLGPDIVDPDIAGWRREHMPKVPKEPPYITVVPDWVCEVLSPSTRVRDITSKRSIYAREGVKHLWYLDPLYKILEVFRLEEVGWVFVGAWEGEAKVKVEPFEAVEINLALLWEE